MAGCQRGLSLSMLATHGYNNILNSAYGVYGITQKNNNKKRATAGAKYKVQQDNVHTI